MGLEKGRREGNDENRANLVVDAPTGLIHQALCGDPILAASRGIRSLCVSLLH